MQQAVAHRREMVLICFIIIFLTVGMGFLDAIKLPELDQYIAGLRSEKPSVAGIVVGSVAILVVGTAAHRLVRSRRRRLQARLPKQMVEDDDADPKLLNKGGAQPLAVNSPPLGWPRSAGPKWGATHRRAGRGGGRSGPFCNPRTRGV